jgi:membrane associated rhomboid family serine protease
MFNNEPRNIGSMVGLTSSVKFLLILNVAIFLLQYMFHMPFADRFALPSHWWTSSFSFWKLFTYMFVHGGPAHLFANMLGLFFIGPTVERTIGSYRFFILYYVSGILGGLGWSMIADPFYIDEYGTQIVPICVGASGAVMGVLGAFGALYPNAKLLLWFVIPVRAWVLVLGLALWELHETTGEPLVGGIANAAHLIGGIAGFSYALSLKHPNLMKMLKSKFSGVSKAKYNRNPPPKEDRLSKAEVDAILDKIGREGMGALSPRERELLKRATRG